MKAYLKMGILSGFVDIPELVSEIYIQWDGKYYKECYLFDEKDYVQPEDTRFKKLVFLKGTKINDDIYEYYYAGVD